MLAGRISDEVVEDHHEAALLAHGREQPFDIGPIACALVVAQPAGVDRTPGDTPPRRPIGIAAQASSKRRIFSFPVTMRRLWSDGSRVKGIANSHHEARIRAKA